MVQSLSIFPPPPPVGESLNDIIFDFVQTRFVIVELAYPRDFFAEEQSKKNTTENKLCGFELFVFCLSSLLVSTRLLLGKKAKMVDVCGCSHLC